MPSVSEKEASLASDRRQRILMEKGLVEKLIAIDDPLFGVLTEEQVGICKETGRRKIAPEVLEEMSEMDFSRVQ